MKGPQPGTSPAAEQGSPGPPLVASETPSFALNLFFPPLPPEHVSTSLSHSGAAERPP